jgi:hypothetical protein
VEDGLAFGPDGRTLASPRAASDLCRHRATLLETARERIGPGSSRTVHAVLGAWQVRAHAAAGEARQGMRVLTCLKRRGFP